MLFPQQPGDRLNLSDFLVGDGVCGAAVATVEQRFLRTFGERGNDLVKDFQFVLSAAQQAGAANQEAHGGLTDFAVLLLTADHTTELCGDLRVFFDLLIGQGDEVRMIAVSAEPPVGNGPGEREFEHRAAEIIDDGLGANGVMVTFGSGG